MEKHGIILDVALNGNILRMRIHKADAKYSGKRLDAYNDKLINAQEEWSNFTTSHVKSWAQRERTNRRPSGINLSKIHNWQKFQQKFSKTLKIGKKLRKILETHYERPFNIL